MKGGELTEGATCTPEQFNTTYEPEEEVGEGPKVKLTCVNMAYTDDKRDMYKWQNKEKLKGITITFQEEYGR